MASTGILFFGTLACVLVTALIVSAAGGMIAGTEQRNTAATQTTVVEIQLQFDLGMQDLAAGNYSLAASRFRWVLDRQPDYPGVQDALLRAEEGAISPNSTIIPTLIASTSENPEELFSEGQAFIAQEDWANAISRLEQVQGIDPTYRQAEVEDMLWTAYSTLGLVYIRGERIEEGLFLLDQAEEIRPLDDLTGGERYLAQLYRTGQVYWGLNWSIVIQNFEEIYRSYPNYRDVAVKLHEAYIKYGDQLVLAGAACDAVPLYETALTMENDPTVLEKQRGAETTCANPIPLATATSPFETPEGGGEATETPEYNGIP